VNKDDYKLNDDTMRDLRRIAQSPGEFEWRMELLAKLERYNQEHDLFVREAVKELKRLDKVKPGLTEVTARIQLELEEKLKPAKGVAKQLGKGALWVLERMALLGVAYIGVKLGLRH
jgi:hypothetical protein